MGVLISLIQIKLANPIYLGLLNKTSATYLLVKKEKSIVTQIYIGNLGTKGGGTYLSLLDFDPLLSTYRSFKSNAVAFAPVLGS